MFGTIRTRVAAIVATALLAVAVCQVTDISQQAVAADASNFNAGNIISDTMFYDARMNVADIQWLLADRGSWLVNYRQTTSTKPSGSYSDGGNETGWGVCSTYFGASDELAAEILYKVQIACGVSAQALLATLQKESSLVTSGTSSNLRSAMGYACPDSNDCDAEYYGFFNQVFGAARSFQWYGNPAPGQYSSKKFAVGNWNILFNPNSACGRKSVYVENRATAALYYYTPYTPNGASLGNLYGLGDGCSSYGNRNFWRIFSDWFGSTQLAIGTQQFIKAAYHDILGRAPESVEAINYYSKALVSGVSRADVVKGFFRSPEYLGIRITEAYNLALGRAPEPGAITYWVGEVQKGRLSADDLLPTFMASQEMFTQQGGSTYTGYVAALYQRALGRTPSSDEVQYYVNRIMLGDPLSSISFAFFNSPEKVNFRVWETYQVFLGRSPSESDFPYWGGYARANGYVAMRSQIMSSPEYWSRGIVWFSQ